MRRNYSTIAIDFLVTLDCYFDDRNSKESICTYVRAGEPLLLLSQVGDTLQALTKY